MSHGNVETAPNSEVVRIVVYLVGFMLGVCAVAVAVYVLFAFPEMQPVAYVVLGLGLTLMGQGGIATAFVPSVRGTRE